jgi:gluconate 2-dehydrogenase alpha chain
VVGKNYAYQTGGAGATGYFKEKKFRRYMGSGALSTALDDLNVDNTDDVFPVDPPSGFYTVSA